MYNNVGSSGGMGTTTLTPYQVGKWQHLVVVYDPVELSNATVTMYVDGVPVVTNVWAGGGSGTDPAYVANTGTQEGFEPPNLAIGNYNNANSSLNPWFGAADEFAFYTNKLTAEQVLAHFQNATNANRSTPYNQLILSHNPVVYLRLDDAAPGPDTAINLGDLRSAGHGIHSAEVNHPVASALNGRADDGAASYHHRNGSSTTAIPYLPENNPDPSVPFTFEAWIKAENDRQNPGAAVVANRYIASGNRTGWVIFQRAPNSTYAGLSGFSGVGWTFRMFTGSGTGGQDVTTDVPYTIGEWQHLVVTWQPHTDVSPAANGASAWQGTLSAYVNGVLVKENAAATYSANTDPTEDASAASDFAVGSYNAASGLGSNPFEGDVDEVALYNGFVLTPDQILEHYNAGTNAFNGTNYETLVLTAGLVSVGGAERVGLPKTYLRFNERAANPARNSGSLGWLADGNQVMASNTIAGPRTPAFAGFSATNTATSFDGLKSWVSLQNPAGLNLAGQVTVEAWIKPAAAQVDPARIVSHGPPSYSFYLPGPPPVDFGAPTNGNELFLQIEGSSPNFSYAFGCSTFTNGVGETVLKVTAAAPAADFGMGNWVHIAGTYDGTHWRLYRNGVEIASAADAVGALPVENGDWAIGAAGNGWTNVFTGEIDEPAIYPNALSKNAVAAHYVIGKAGTTALAISKSGSSVNISWPAGTTLQQSTTGVTGPYTDVPGSPVSPLAVTPSGTVFYRWRL